MWEGASFCTQLPPRQLIPLRTLGGGGASLAVRKRTNFRPPTTLLPKWEGLLGKCSKWYNSLDPYIFRE